VAAAGALAGLGLLGKRIASPVLRGLSSPDDYVANVLTTTFAALAALAAFLPGAREAWFVAGAALLVYVPVGKIRHCLLFFPARYELGRFFGRRGTFPPASRRTA
jgi:nitrate reductase gamma subunit